MAQTPASKLQDHLKHVVQRSGGQYRKVRWEGRNGCPDCLIWWDWPAMAFVEVKADRDRVSKVQDREIERMRNYDIPVFIVRTMNDIDEVVEKVRKGIAT